MTKPRITIVGSGLVGLTIAIQLQQHGYPTTLVGHPPKKNPTMHFALHHNHHQFLSEIGLHCPSRPIKKMNIYFGQSPITLNAEKSKHPTLCHIVSQSDLLSSCINHPHLKNILWIKSPPTDLNHMTLTIDSSEIESDVLIACDGSHSWLRKQTPIHIQHYPYQQYAHIAVLSLKQALLTADQYFFSDGILAYLPCQNPYQAMMIWSCSKETHMNILKNGIKHHIKQCPSSTKIIQISKHQHIPLNAMLASTYQHHSILLAGNALHTIHPLAGMGLNLGLSDGIQIVKMLNEGRNLKYYTVEREHAHIKGHWLTHTLAHHHQNKLLNKKLMSYSAAILETQMLNFVDSICL